jgi:hypothetical protein
MTLDLDPNGAERKMTEARMLPNKQEPPLLFNPIWRNRPMNSVRLATIRANHKGTAL